jgi:hypothetical protein
MAPIALDTPRLWMRDCPMKSQRNKRPLVDAPRVIRFDHLVLRQGQSIGKPRVPPVPLLLTGMPDKQSANSSLPLLHLD